MFCKNCGTNVGDASFCPNCGTSNSGASPNIYIVSGAPTETFQQKITRIGHAKLIKLTAFIAAVINIVIRIVTNEVKTVRVALAVDDYFVVSTSGRVYMLMILALQVIISISLFVNAKKNRIAVTTSTVVLSVILLALQIAAMVLRLPAPY